MTCNIINEFQAWHMTLQRWETAQMLECRSAHKVEYKTKPEGLFYIDVDGSRIWLIDPRKR